MNRIVDLKQLLQFFNLHKKPSVTFPVYQQTGSDFDLAFQIQIKLTTNTEEFFDSNINPEVLDALNIILPYDPQ